MTYATVRRAAEHIARAGKITPHQLAALTALDQGLTDEQRQGFTDLWRVEGSPAAKVAQFIGHELQQHPAKLSPKSPFSARLTPHINLGEFALGQESRRFDHQHQVDTAAELAAFMERCRARFGGKPVIITSGYRPAAINRSVGGASASEHLYSAPGVGAVDFYIQGESISAVQSWVDREWSYSVGYGAPKGFVHLGIRSGRPRVRWDY